MPVRVACVAMLVARGHTTLGEAKLAWALTFGRKLWVSVVERDGLLFDTRFVPPSAEATKPNACLYVLLRGAWRMDGPGGVRFEGPSAFVLSDEQLEGGGGARSLTFSASGHPFATIEVHVPVKDLVHAPSPIPQRVELDARTWEAALHAGQLGKHDDETLVLAVTKLVALLAERGIVSEAAAKSAARGVPSPFARLWKALRPMVERLYLSPTLDEVSAGSGVSARQVDRYVREFQSAFGLIGAGWRPATRHLRLKLSVVLLSARGVSIAEVARIVGYGSPDAMARAFRDAKLPAPSTVQAELHAPR